MKLYTFPPAPNPRRLNTYVGEKQLRIPVEIVNLTTGAFLKRPSATWNPDPEPAS